MVMNSSGRLGVGVILIFIGLLSSSTSAAILLMTIFAVGIENIGKFSLPPLAMYIGSSLLFILPGSYLVRVESGTVFKRLGYIVFLVSLTPLISVLYPSFEALLIGLVFIGIGGFLYWIPALLLVGIDYGMVKTLSIGMAAVAIATILLATPM